MTTNDELPETEKHQRLIEAIASTIRSCTMLVGLVVIWLIAVEAMIGAGFWLDKRWQDPAGETASGDPRANLPVYHNVPDDRKFAVDKFKVHFEPYYHWRRDPIASPYINVDADGVRKTVKSPAAGAIRVFMFGGSTTWGTGVADAYTIPSLLQRRLGPGYDVYNYGETAFVSAQELNLLLRELAFGNVPDVVIFYDGFNDGYAGVYSPAIPRDPQNERIRQQNQGKAFHQQVIGRTNMYALFDRMRDAYHREKGKPTRWDQNVAQKISENSRKTLDVYEQFVFQARALATAYGFQVFFFWQPHLLSGTRKALAYEKEIIAKESPVLVEAMQQLYREAKNRLSNRERENVFFLGNVFDDDNEPTYIDGAHLGPCGNEVIAEEMFKRLRGGLRSKRPSAERPAPPPLCRDDTGSRAHHLDGRGTDQRRPV